MSLLVLASTYADAPTDQLDDLVAAAVFGASVAVVGFGLPMTVFFIYVIGAVKRARRSLDNALAELERPLIVWLAPHWAVAVLCTVAAVRLARVFSMPEPVVAGSGLLVGTLTILAYPVVMVPGISRSLIMVAYQHVAERAGYCVAKEHHEELALMLASGLAPSSRPDRPLSETRQLRSTLTLLEKARKSRQDRDTRMRLLQEAAMCDPAFGPEYCA